jgi:hypothetical protein
MKKTFIRCLLFLPLLAFLGACATDEIAPTNPQVLAKLQTIDHTQKATMVIYRPENAIGRGKHPTVMLDGKDFVDMANGQVFVTAINPGNYVLEMDDKKSGTQVTLKPGDEVFLKIEMQQGTWSFSGKMTQVMPQQGNYEATRLELVDPSSINLPAYR